MERGKIIEVDSPRWMRVLFSPKVWLTKEIVPTAEIETKEEVFDLERISVEVVISEDELYFLDRHKQVEDVARGKLMGLANAAMDKGINLFVYRGHEVTTVKKVGGLVRVRCSLHLAEEDVYRFMFAGGVSEHLDDAMMHLNYKVGAALRKVFAKYGV